MINFNGELLSETTFPAYNRAFLFGDGVFETVRISNGKFLFAEDHYFRLMAAMRIVRMEIPMNFTLEFFEQQIMSVVITRGYSNARVRMTVFRNGAGLYLPQDRTVSFVVEAGELENAQYGIQPGDYEVDLYRDFYVTAHLLSTLKTTNRIINVTGSIFAAENGLDNCFLLNEAKNVVEALQGNVFMFTGDKLITPPVSDGCLNGIMRKQVLAITRKMEGIEVSEEIVSPFELQKAEELFITNVITGIQPVTKYRKKQYGQEFAAKLISELNKLIGA